MGQIEDILNKGKNLIVNRQSRSVFVLFVTIFIVFALNSLLPVIEGSTHYTADAVTMTYKEYKDKIAVNKNYRMTWVSSKKIEAYIHNYIVANPGLSLDDQLLIEPPDGFKIDVYTKFFFQHPFWYMTTLVNLISALLIFYSLFNHLITKRKSTYKKYIDLEHELDSLNQESLDPVTFEPWIQNDFNKPRKIKQHISNVKYQLEKLERRTPYKYKHADTESPYRDKYIMYYDKKCNLQSLLDSEYIEQYVMDRKVKGFLYIYPSFVTSGHNMTGRTMDSFSNLKSNAQRLGRDSIKKVVISTLLTTMFATLLTVTIINSTDKPWYWVVLNIITSITPLIMQVPMAFDYCDKYMEEQLITNLIARRTIAYLYLADIRSKEDVFLKEVSQEKLEIELHTQQEENIELEDTLNENKPTEGHGDPSVPSNRGDTEEYSEQT